MKRSFDPQKNHDLLRTTALEEKNTINLNPNLWGNPGREIWGWES